MLCVCTHRTHGYIRAVLGGAVVATVGDVVFASLLHARPAISMSFQRQLQLVDVFPLVGVLCFGVLFARALDTRAAEGRATSGYSDSPLECHVYVPLVIAEALALFNIVSLVVAFKSRCGWLLSAPPHPRTGTEGGTGHGGGVVRDDDHGQRASDTSRRSNVDSRILLRESNQLSLEESMFDNPVNVPALENGTIYASGTAQERGVARRPGSRRKRADDRNVVPYGVPYIDNPTFAAALGDTSATRATSGGTESGGVAQGGDASPAEPPHVLFTPMARTKSPLLPGSHEHPESRAIVDTQPLTLVRPHPPQHRHAHGHGLATHLAERHDVAFGSEIDAANCADDLTLSSGVSDVGDESVEMMVGHADDGFEQESTSAARVVQHISPSVHGAAPRVSVVSMGRISIASGDTVEFGTTEDVAGRVLDERSVRIGMCVYVNARLADPKAALLGNWCPSGLSNGCVLGMCAQRDSARLASAPTGLSAEDCTMKERAWC